MQNIPKVHPIKVKEYENKQSKYEMVPKLPVRSIILGPSGSGKTLSNAKYGLRYLPWLLQ